MDYMNTNYYEEKFKDMWTWIYEQTIRKKRKIKKDEYFKINKIDYNIRPNSNCYACEFAGTNIYGDVNCEKCPLLWTHNDKTLKFTCFNENSLYKKWYHCTDWKKAAELAKQISELEWIY